MEKEKIAAALREAKELMNDTGAHWTQYDLRTRTYDEEAGEWKNDFKYCSLGAIYKITGVDLDKIVWYDEIEGNVYAEGEIADAVLSEGDLELRQAMIEALSEQIRQSDWTPPTWWNPTYTKDLAYTITSWNDHGARFWEEIAEVFEAAAQRVEASDA